MLRIITGEHKGKRLFSREGEDTRPTSERIKGAMFSSIQFDIEKRRVLDLFAGTGQLGLEALSRGAESALFIDSSREAIEVVRKNIALLKIEDKCKTVQSDYRTYINKLGKMGARFDLVFIDPPYGMMCCTEALKRLKDSSVLALGSLIVMESGEEDVDSALSSVNGFEVIKSQSYGKKTTVNILIFRGKEE